MNANRMRGEVAFACGEEQLALCLTLGALAEIETIMTAPDFVPARPSATALLGILAALLKGGGEYRAARAVDRLPVQPAEVLRAIAAAFAAADGVP